jgi:hypothetical protein
MTVTSAAPAKSKPVQAEEPAALSDSGTLEFSPDRELWEQRVALMNPGFEIGSLLYEARTRLP